MLDKFDITVFCVVTSYLGIVEDKYKSQMFYCENINGINILRIRVREFRKTNTMSCTKNILAYFFGAMIATFKVDNQNGVFSISQLPILGGKWMKRAKFSYSIQNFNSEQVLAVNFSKNRLITGVRILFDKFSCHHSNLIITVGRNFVLSLVLGLCWIRWWRIWKRSRWTM